MSAHADSYLSNRCFVPLAAVLTLCTRQSGLFLGRRLHSGCTRSNGQVPVGFRGCARREVQMRPNHVVSEHLKHWRCNVELYIYVCMCYCCYHVLFWYIKSLQSTGFFILLFCCLDVLSHFTHSYMDPIQWHHSLSPNRVPAMALRFSVDYNREMKVGNFWSCFFMLKWNGSHQISLKIIQRKKENPAHKVGNQCTLWSFAT